MSRRIVFEHYWRIALIACAVLVAAAYFLGGEGRVGLIGSCVAGVLGFCYFVQQQKLAETHLFHRLFTDFNARYDKFNGPLVEMAEGEPKSRSNNAI